MHWLWIIIQLHSVSNWSRGYIDVLRCFEGDEFNAVLFRHLCAIFLEHNFITKLTGLMQSCFSLEMGWSSETGLNYSKIENKQKRFVYYMMLSLHTNQHNTYKFKNKNPDLCKSLLHEEAWCKSYLSGISATTALTFSFKFDSLI